MTFKVPDFKDSCGDWVYRFQEADGTRYFTRSGMLFHALKQRTNPEGVKQKASPLYVGCTHEFKDFQDFAEWCQYQIGFDKGFHMDKDLLIKWNKVYSKDTILFIPQEINKLFTRRDRFRGDLPIGVSWERGKTSYKANLTMNGVHTYLGNFKTMNEAFQAYKTTKESFIKQQAEKWKDQIDPRAYDALMNYVVEITD